MADVYIGMGSNLGRREAFLEEAIVHIQHQIGPIRARSSFFETKPWGFVSDNLFLNACLRVSTALSPSNVLLCLKQIENEMGRLKTSVDGYSDRVIDLDILLYESLQLKTERLEIPHPRMSERRFVLEPMTEIAPMLIHPTLGKRMFELLDELNSTP